MGRRNGSLPDGLTPVGAPAGSWVAETHKLTLSLAALGGWTGMNVASEATGPFTFHAELYWRDTLLTTREVTLPQEWITRLSVEGGLARGLRDRVQVAFPSGALPGGAEVHIRPLRQGVVPYSLSGNPIEITAISQSNGEELHQFAQPITITVNYSGTQIRGDESMLTLFYYEADPGVWTPMTSRVDTTAHTLTASSDHLSAFDFKAQDWEAARLPSLKAFQVSSFTGAATYSFPIQVPPGPAGLQPSLSVSYNSQTVDGAGSRTQASWVGMGWSLDTGSIQRNMNGTPNYLEDDTFSLQTNGVGGTLLPVTDTDGNPNTIDYRLADDDFWRIRQYVSTGNNGGYTADTSYWVAWDKNGNRYYFGGDAPTTAQHAYYMANFGFGNIMLETWKWPMTAMVDKFGQELQYTYQEETGVKDVCGGCQSTVSLAMYPQRIVYPNSRYRVEFVATTVTPGESEQDARHDYDGDWLYAPVPGSGWFASAATSFFQRSLLDKVEVWQDPDGAINGNSRLIRRYQFNYDFGMIFPGATWNHSGGIVGRTPSLSSIQEYGFDGAGPLPSTSFTYDSMHLTAADNGYSGIVILNYETSPWYELSSDSDPVINTYGESPRAPDFYWADDPVEVFYPGQEVKVSLCTTYVSLSNVSLGVYDGTQNNPAQGLTYQDLANADCYGRFFTGYVRLPPDATQERFYYQVSIETFIPYSFKAYPLTTRARVISRVLSDPVYSPDESSATRYRYDDAATNDAAHSQLVASSIKDRRYNPAYGEYRGNSLVKEIDPGGKVSTTFFYQDDDRNGKPSASLVATENVTETFPTTTWSDYSSKWASGSPTPIFERVTGDIAAKVVDTAGTWNSSIYRTSYSVENNEAVVVQFRVITTTQQTIIAVNSITPDSRRWGIKQFGSTLYLHNCIGTPSTCDNTTPTTPLLQNVVPNAWYVLVLIVDDDADDVNNPTDNHFLMRVWRRDDPSQYGKYEEEMASAWSTRDWRFMAKVKSGTLWLDEYSEGKLYSLNETIFGVNDPTRLAVSLESVTFQDPFNSLSANWIYTNHQSIEWLDGNPALSNTESGWGPDGTISRPSYNLRDQAGYSNAILARIRFGGWGEDAFWGLKGQNGSNYYLWGIKSLNQTFYAGYSLDGYNWQWTTLPNKATTNIWYGLLLVIDSDKFVARIWQLDHPTVGAYYEYDMPVGADTASWFFYQQTGNGTFYMDDYLEGQVPAATMSAFQYQPFAGLPVKQSGGGAYLDLKIAWTYQTEQRSSSFEGDATWTGTRATNDYNTADQNGGQYGNLTRVLEAWWDAANSRWQDYRLSRTLYYPNAGTPQNPLNLVGLPAMAKTYSCLSTDYNGACMTGYAESRLTSSQWSLYDTHTSYSDLPTEGKLTGRRVLIECNGTCSTSTEYFNDSVFTYDSYGNRTITYVYTTKNGYNSYAQGTSIPSYSCYGGGTVGGYTCNDDGYHTFVLWERNVLGHVTSMNYSSVAVYNTTITGYALSVPVSLTDPNNVTTGTEYDVYGRMTAIKRYGDDHTNPTARMSYQDTASPFYTQAEQRITGTTYFKIRKYYNGVGQLLQTQVIGAVVNGVTKDIRVDRWYTHSGQVWKTSVPYDGATGSGYLARDSGKTYNAYNTYDALGRPEYVYATDGTATHYVYRDLETEVTDANSYTTHTTTDVWGRTSQVNPPPSTGPSVNYTYDTRNHLITVSYGNANSNYTYDIAGRKLTMSDPDLGSWSYTYDALGNLSTQHDSRGCTITLSYDSLNRLTGKSYSGCATTTAPTYTYDTGGNKGIGRRTSMTDGSGSTSWTYDERGRVMQESKAITGSGTFKTQWTYNSADLPVTMVYPGDNNNGAGETVTFTYNPQMLLDTVTGAYYYVKGTKYDAAGRTDLLSLGVNGSAERVAVDYLYYGWDEKVNNIGQGARLKQLKIDHKLTTPATTLQDLRYTYDAVGNVLTILDVTNSSQKQCFQYDALNRLKKGTTYTDPDHGCTTQLGNGNYDESYTYNVNTGNLETKTGMGTYAYNGSHKHAVASTTNGDEYLYDNNGNMTHRDPVGGTYYDYTYDAENRLTAVSGSSTASFTYDGDSVRVKSVVGGTTTAFVGNYFEWTGSTSTMKKYYYAGGTRIAVRSGSNPPSWLLNDHLGSTTLSVDHNTGTVTSATLYKPWGTTRYTSGTSPTKYTFTGQYSNVGDFGLLFYNARWYDPSLGRFNQPDNVNPQDTQGTQGWDRFAYVNNNPIVYNDPTGHVPWYIPGWSDQIARKIGIQTGNMCALTAITAGLNTLGIPVTKEEMYAFGQLTAAPQAIVNLGIPPVQQAWVVNLSGTASAECYYGSDRANLLSDLKQGYPIVVSVSWNDSSIGHALLVTGYDPATGEFQFYDPGTGKPINETDFKNFYGVSFDQAWLNKPNFFIPSGSLVILKKNKTKPPSNNYKGLPIPGEIIPLPGGGRYLNSPLGICMT